MPTNETLAAAGAPQSTKEERVSLPCALKDFFPYAELSWKYCRAEQPLFLDESDRFTKEFIDEQEALIKRVKTLPNNDARLAAVTNANVLLVGKGQALKSMAKRLGNGISYTYKVETLIDAERKEAGLTAYMAAKEDSWSSAADFIVTATNYLEAKGQKLVEAKGLKSTFAKEFENIGTAFGTAWSDFTTKDKAAATGTAELQKGLKAILAELTPMQGVGKSIFEFNATKRKEFTESYLLDEVRTKHQAALRGFVKLASTDKPRVGLRVEILGEEGKFAVTDKRGFYEINVAGGTYDVLFTSEDTLPLTIAGKVVKPGVKGRLSVEVELKPVEVPAPPPVADPQPTTPSPEMNGVTNTDGVLEIA